MFRSRGALALGKIGSVDAVPALTQSLKDPNQEVRASAAKSLGKDEKNGDSSGTDSSIARRVIVCSWCGSRSIRQNRSRRCSTSSNLSRQDKQEYVRFSTSTALLRIGTPGAIKAIIEICPGLIRVLQDQKWNIRAAVADTLG